MTNTPSFSHRIAIFTDSRGWHEKQLRRALASRNVEAVLLSLTKCSSGYGPASCYGLHLPGFEHALPDAVFVRHIPAGSFEQVTFRLDILHALQECGVPVYNSARVIERTVDKAMTSFLLNKAGVPTPAVWVSENIEQTQKILRRETAAGRRVVLKPLFGSRGKGLKLLDNTTNLPELEAHNGMYYLQSFIGPNIDSDGKTSRDWRVMVIGGRAVAAMERQSEHWITNKAQGGQCQAVELNDGLATLAERATAAVSADYAGVDVMQDGNGDYQVLEINGIPAWSGLQSVCDLDISQALVDDLLTRLPGQRIEAVS